MRKPLFGKDAKTGPAPDSLGSGFFHRLEGRRGSKNVGHRDSEKVLGEPEFVELLKTKFERAKERAKPLFKSPKEQPKEEISPVFLFEKLKEKNENFSPDLRTEDLAVSLVKIAKVLSDSPDQTWDSMCVLDLFASPKFHPETMMTTVARIASNSPAAYFSFDIMGFEALISNSNFNRETMMDTVELIVVNITTCMGFAFDAFSAFIKKADTQDDLRRFDKIVEGITPLQNRAVFFEALQKYFEGPDFKKETMLEDASRIISKTLAEQGR
ncbi:MAG: hypothetical protein NT157_01355 [Candidatus Micrarchaeota archaeon]|nr:hypothetical protein [Candidatus Micrarchaeota archaeon]